MSDDLNDFERLLTNIVEGGAMLSRTRPPGSGDPLNPDLLEDFRIHLGMICSPSHDQFVVNDGHEHREQLTLASKQRDLYLDTSGDNTLVTSRGMKPWYLAVTHFFLRRTEESPEFKWHFDNGAYDDLEFFELQFDGRLLCRYPVARDLDEWMTMTGAFYELYADDEHGQEILDQLKSANFWVPTLRW